ncbi:MAG: hypothetical protein GY796_27705 [Chloroflexi bacterium]|nr:hypothetical protein [Chloroflexota bacterium]
MINFLISNLPNNKPANIILNCNSSVNFGWQPTILVSIQIACGKLTRETKRPMLKQIELFNQAVEAQRQSDYIKALALYTAVLNAIDASGATAKSLELRLAALRRCGLLQRRFPVCTNPCQYSNKLLKKKCPAF